MNNIIDIYPQSDVVTTQVYNTTDNVYQIKAFKIGENDEAVKTDYDVCNSNNMME
jgi:hypothetical protein